MRWGDGGPPEGWRDKIAFLIACQAAHYADDWHTEALSRIADTGIMIDFDDKRPGCLSDPSNGYLGSLKRRLDQDRAALQRGSLPVVQIAPNLSLLGYTYTYSKARLVEELAITPAEMTGMRVLVDQDTDRARKRMQDRDRKRRTRIDNTVPQPSRGQHAAALAETGYTYADIAKTLGISSVNSAISRGRERGPAIHLDLPHPAATKMDSRDTFEVYDGAPLGLWLKSPAGSFTVYPATERGHERLPELAVEFKAALLRGRGIASFLFSSRHQRGDFTVVAELQESGEGLLDRAAMFGQVRRTFDRLQQWLQENLIVRTPVGRVSSLWTFEVQNAAHARGIPVIPAVSERPELSNRRLESAISGAPCGSMKVVGGAELNEIKRPRDDGVEAA